MEVFVTIRCRYRFISTEPKCQPLWGDCSLECIIHGGFLQAYLVSVNGYVSACEHTIFNCDYRQYLSKKYLESFDLDTLS